MRIEAPIYKKIYLNFFFEEEEEQEQEQVVREEEEEDHIHQQARIPQGMSAMAQTE